MQRLKSVVKLLAVIAGALTILIGILLAYSQWKVGWSKTQATALCDSAEIGKPITGLKKKAQELGLRVHVLPDVPPSAPGAPPNQAEPGKMLIMAWEGFVFARWFCYIHFSDNVVTKKKVVFLD